MKQLILPLDVNDAEGDSDPAQSSAVNLGPSLEMVGRDAAPAQLMHQDQGECAPQDIGCMCQ